MKYLLDTHTAIWAFSDDNNDELSKTVKAIIADSVNSLYISFASAWELAIKVSIKKLNYNGGVSAFIRHIKENRIELLGVKDSYIECVEALPLIHGDPFDRLIISTAKTENMTILTTDKHIPKYDVKTLW